MKSPYKIAVESAFLNQAICWPGMVGSEKTLTDKKIKGIKMWLMPYGLICQLKDKKGIEQRIIVEKTTIINLIISPDELIE